MNALTLGHSMRDARASVTDAPPLIITPEDHRYDDKLLWTSARAWIADACFASLVVTRWLSVTILATLGLYVLFFLALGDFTPEGAFAQLDNLARRYLDASADRQQSFLRGTLGTFALMFLVLASFRWRALTIHFVSGKVQHHG